MIRYSLTCEKAHDFDSWFAGAEAFAALQGAGHLACPVCGSSKVEKALMAPAVRPARKAESAAAGRTAQQAAGPLRGPASEIEEAIAEMRRQIEANSDYVGMNFAAEARAIHEGEAPERSIYGEAKPDEARALLEDGIPVAPLPFLPQRKAN